MAGLDRDEAFKSMMVQIFGTDDTVLAGAVRTVMNIHLLRHFGGVSENLLCTRDYSGLAISQHIAIRASRDIIHAMRGKVTAPLGIDCLNDLLDALDDKIFSGRFQRLVHEILDRGFTPERGSAFATLRKEYGEYLDHMEQLWSVYRPGIEPNVFTQKTGGVKANLADLEKRLATNTWVRVACCLPDGYGVEKIQLDYFSLNEWHTAGAGVYKSTESEKSLYSRFIPLAQSIDKVEKIRITASGLGGVGVTFAEVCCNGRKYVPDSIESTSGAVNAPQYMLYDDSRYSWFGGQDTRYDYFHKEAAAEKHSCVIDLKEKSISELELP